MSAAVAAWTLSFTLVQFLYLDLSLETNWKSAAFQRRALTLICLITRQPSLFPVSFARWVVMLPLQSAYSSPAVLRGEPIGFTVFRVSDTRLT
jgi:hypothetical protein